MRFSGIFGLTVGLAGFVLVASVSVGSGASLQAALVRGAGSGAFMTAVGWMAGMVMSSAAQAGSGKAADSESRPEGHPSGQPEVGQESGQRGRTFDLVIPPTSPDDLWQPLNPPKAGS